MFEDARTEPQSDRLGLVVADVEEWLDDNGYEVSGAQRSGRLEFDEPGYGVVAENDALTIGFLEHMGGTPAFRTYMLEELWGMEPEEWQAELEELAEEG